MDELATGQQFHSAGHDRRLHLVGPDDADRGTFFGSCPASLVCPTGAAATTPVTAGNVIGTIIGEAERQLRILRKVTEQSLSTASRCTQDSIWRSGNIPQSRPGTRRLTGHPAARAAATPAR